MTFDEVWRRDVLDPWRFIEARNRPGGPAPATVEAAISAERELLARDQHLHNDVVARIKAAVTERATKIDAIVAE